MKTPASGDRKNATSDWIFQWLLAVACRLVRGCPIQSIKFADAKIPFDFHLLQCQNRYGNAAIRSGNPFRLSDGRRAEAQFE
jgi:hypothetical protein